MTSNDEVLNSWKEVATYLGRGVRTVQRWEQELGLPVRRPRGKSRSAVIAFKSELDNWLRRAPAEQLAQATGEPQTLPPIPGRHDPNRKQMLFQRTTILMDRTKQLLSRTNGICELLKEVQQRVDQAINLTKLQVLRNSEVPPPPFPGLEDQLPLKSIP